MTKRTVAAAIAGLAVAGAIAGVQYAKRQPAVRDSDVREIEEFGEGLGEMGKGLHRMGKGLHRMGRGMNRSFEESVSGQDR